MSVQKLYLANLLTSGSNESIKSRYSFLESGKIFSLETFYKGPKVAKVLTANPDVKILLDSGAHTLIHKAIQQGIEKSLTGKEKMDSITFDLEQFDSLPKEVQRLMATTVSKSTDLNGFLRGSTSRFVVDWTYFDSTEVKKFMDDYVQYVHKYNSQLYEYINLDVIFNPERTWDHQKYLESNGLKPIPVFHFGEDIKWLKKYMDNYDYIGIGGLGQDVTKAKFIIYQGDPVFKLLGESKQEIKTHGFAVTSLDLMLRYKWFSVDSTTWVKHAAYGSVLVPKYNRKTKQYDYGKNAILISVSDRSKIGTPNRPHYTLIHTEEEIQQIRSYFEVKGMKETDLETVWEARVNANIEYYRDLSLFLRNYKQEKRAIQKRFF